MVAIFCMNPDKVVYYQKRFEVLILRKKEGNFTGCTAQEFSQAEALTIFLDKQTKGPDLHTQD